ncbi:helix-turn-helix transcriptional regulator [Aeromonas hydrophila]|uniref:helix-turn-helix transcriptional regulator n=1 Tax=Aeromonas hydrophila TaxID=644 RepID=UPI000953F86E|nr:AlpA family phage regulatory protein [Aeromonas hydrophila]SIR14029.1 transcriptional regulator, AlpA family [Aeromonas hydrophila]SIR22963.1 transcriptional regulator, AlpA family [Aeromonas hydrophila]
MLSNVLRPKYAIKALGISSAKFFDMQNPKSPRFDPTFPKRIRLGANSVGYLENEIMEWLKSRQEV